MRQPSIFINKEKNAGDQKRTKGTKDGSSDPSHHADLLGCGCKGNCFCWLSFGWSWCEISIVKKPTKIGGWKCIWRLPRTLTCCNVVVAVWADTYHWIRSKHSGILTKMQQTSFCTRSPFGKNPKIYGEEIRTTNHLWFPIWCATKTGAPWACKEW